VIVHLAEVAQVSTWALEMPPAAHLLAQRFWPGALTLILHRAPQVLDAVTGGQDTVALRIPSHPVARRLLQAFGGGIAAPSANRFGRISATRALHVQSEFGGEVALVLDGGACDAGIESTIVDVSGAAPALLRPGAISAAALARVLGAPLAEPARESPRAPGTLASHYAPRTPLMLVESDLLAELAATLIRQHKKVAVLARSALQPLLPELIWRAAPEDAQGYAHDLYAALRELDASGCDVIIAERPPADAAWAAVRDRLQRASVQGKPE
jgi:L-threonylcarbamoyladenylate synthase